MQSGKQFSGESFFFLSTENMFRKICIRIITSKYFENFILLIIFLNCIFLAMDTKAPDFEGSNTYNVINTAEYAFIGIFTLEMILKAVGMGFIIGKNAYLRDAWNIIDFLVVVLGYISFLDLGNYTAIRSVRFLRPLRTIGGIAGLRQLVATLLTSIPMLLDVLILCAFAFAMFGIIAIQVFAGELSYRCADIAFDSSTNATSFTFLQDQIETPCSGPRIKNINDISWGLEGNNLEVGALENGDGLFKCSGERTYCIEFENPNYGFTSFDDILHSWLTIYTAISLEGWTDVMYFVQDAVSPWVWIYFVVLIAFCSFFIVNLALAVLVVHFTKEKSSESSESEQSSPKGEVNNEIKIEKEFVDATHEYEPESTIRKVCYKIQAHQHFETVTIIFIALNTITMAMEREPMSDKLKDFTDYSNYAFTAYFVIEMIIKLAGLGLEKYVEDRLNVFDAIIVFISVLEVAIGLINDNKGNGMFSVFRAFRLLRIFKLVRSWKELHHIINTVFRSLASIAYLSLILLLFLFIFALLGKEFFGYKFAFCDYVESAKQVCPPGVTDCPRHFDCYLKCNENDLFTNTGTFMTVPNSRYNGMAKCEKYCTGENCMSSSCWTNSSSSECWAEVGYSDVARHNFDDIYSSFITIYQVLTGENWNEVMYDGMRTTSPISSLYFVILTLLGNYIVLNLFLAILLENFGGTPDEVEVPPEQPRLMKRKSSFLTINRVQDITERSALNDKALNFFRMQNPVRRRIYMLVSGRSFEYFIILLIFLSSIALALDSPSLTDASKLKKVLNGLDIFFTIAFALEVVLKILAYGFIVGENTYMRSSWNIIDFLIAVTGVLVLALSGLSQLESLRALRTVRALRPLKVAGRAESMKVVVDALFKAIPPIFNVALVCLLIYVVFGIFGVNLFAGRFHYCQNDLTEERIDPRIIFPEADRGQIDKIWCDVGQHLITYPAGIEPYNLTHSWTKPELNFDNIENSMLTLFEMSTLEMWPDVMYASADITGKDKQPVINSNRYIEIFYVIFLTVGGFFLLNLFVGATIDKFSEMKSKGTTFLTKKQQEWVKIQRIASGAYPKAKVCPPDNKFRRYIHSLVTSNGFESFILGAIVLNVFFMALVTSDMSKEHEATLHVANLFFSFLFLAEMIVRIFGIGFKSYFKDYWYRYDFMIVCISMTSLILSFTSGTDIRAINMFRIFRVGRIFRLIPKAKGLRNLFQTLYYSLPALGNVCSVLFLFFFIYATMGMALYGRVKYGENLNRHANFNGFFEAILVLFRMTTGESWNGIMHDCMIRKNCIEILNTANIVCSSNGGGDCHYVDPGDPILDSLKEDEDYLDRCGTAPIVAIMFFCSFVVLCAFLLLNLLIAVILDNFEDSQKAISIGQDTMLNFVDVWNEFDPEGTHYMDADKVQTLIKKLDPPLGTKGKCPSCS